MSTTLYWVQYAVGGGTPTGAQIVAGQDSTGSAALASGNVTYTGAGTYDAASASTTLTSNSGYVTAWVAYDGTTYSSVVVSSTITTLAIRPGTDVSTTGWTFNGTSLASSIGEITRDDTIYAQAPYGVGPAITTLDTNLVAGSYIVNFAGEYLSPAASSGQFRFTALDGSNTSLGTTSWQPVTSTLSQYSLVLVVSGGTAVRLKLEIQP